MSVVRAGSAYFAVLFALCVGAAPAGATSYVYGTGEPAFTNTTTNTQWIGWTRYSSYGYARLATSFLRGDPPVPYGSESVVEIGSWETNASGVEKFNWTSRINPLQNNVYYSMCGTVEKTVAGSAYPFTPEGVNSCGAISIPKLSGTTIDRTLPAITFVSVGGDAEYTNAGAGEDIPINGVYNDAVSPPSANFICLRLNRDPASACNGVVFDYSAPCSSYASSSARANNPFSCSYKVGSGDPDGPLTFCVRASDLSLPDKPSDPDQFSGLTAANSNISQPLCSYVILDRAAPQLSIGGAPSSSRVGGQVQVSATATDPPAGVKNGSGLSGTYSWSWGDNTPDGAGASAAHTYTQPGVYQIRVATTDKAGNKASATRNITVGTSSGGTTGGGETAPPSNKEITKLVGGGGTQSTTAGQLTVTTAKTLKASKKPKYLPLALTATAPGDATFALVRGGKISAQSALRVAKAGSVGYRLKLPKRLSAGRYQLKVTFRADGQAAASLKTVRITVKGGKSAGKSAVASVAAMSAGGVKDAPAATPQKYRVVAAD